MLSEIKKSKMFARRAVILGSAKALLITTLISRLYYLQLIKQEEYKTFSDSNRIKLFLVPALRGRILDRLGEIIADSQNFYRVIFDPERASNRDKIIELLPQVLELNEEQTKNVVTTLKEHKSRRPTILFDRLTWRQVARFEVNSPDLPGTFIDVGHSRFYPIGTIAAHLIGTVGPVSEADIEKNRLLNHPDFKVGSSGVEKLFDQKLRGKVGVKRVEVNAFGMSVRELSREESVPGKDLNLTVNRELQQFVDSKLEGRSGCVTVLDIRSGDVLAMSSAPAFDPNQFTYKVSSTYWKWLSTNLDKPLINKVIDNQYPPGSTFKLVVALAAQKDGVPPGFTVNCTGAVALGSTVFKCWKQGGHGVMNMKSAIANSCNSYFYRVAHRLGVDKIAEMARKFGLGEETGIGLPETEEPGLVPSSEWKYKKYKEKWQMGDTYNVGIGQGYVLATPLQLAVMVARVASGTKVVPRIAHENPNGTKLPDKPFKKIDVDPSYLDLVRSGMNNVVNIAGGTAFRSRIEEAGYSMAGKTGTVQVISKKALEKYKHKMTEEQLKRTQNHALFVGYGPVTNPAIAISVVIEHGGGGSAAAAPVAKEVMHLAEKLMQVKDVDAEAEDKENQQ